MTIRKYPLVTNEYYHIFNRSVGQQPIFRNVREKNLFTEIIEYYHFSDKKPRFSFYSRLPQKQRKELLHSLYKNNNKHVEILSFCLMPNHYHLLAKQTSDNGVSEFCRFVQESYAKYFNRKTQRFGSLFQSPFKAVRIENDEQLLHVSRYVHLNPLTSYIIRDENDLIKYLWNSYVDYISNNAREFISTSLIRSLIKKEDTFKNFTFNQLDYQRKLESIRHLVFE